MTFWTLRHPPVDREGRCVGQSELALTIPIGDAVTQVLTSAPIVPRRLYSSDLPRCADLARGLAEAWQVELCLTPELRELSFGLWEGRHYDAIDREDHARWRAWCDDWRHVAPPGGETLTAFSARIMAWLQRHQPDSDTLLVTHAGVIRAIEVMGGKTWDEAMASSPPFLGWNEHSLAGL